MGTVEASLIRKMEVHSTLIQSTFRLFSMQQKKVFIISMTIKLSKQTDTVHPKQRIMSKDLNISQYSRT